MSQFFGPIKIVQPHHFLLNRLCEARQVSSRAFVRLEYRFHLFLRFWNCVVFFFPFYNIIKSIYSVGYDMTIFAMTTMIILLCLLVVVSTGSDSIVTLQTRLENIKGISSTFTLNNITKPYTIFRNIPFAQAPIGELRFRSLFHMDHGMAPLMQHNLDHRVFNHLNTLQNTYQ